MDALVYEDTPLATYFEGEAVPYDLAREDTPPHTPFAPTGLPDFKDRLDTIRHRATEITRRPNSAEQLLERFRYIIVASQLLTEEVGQHSSVPDHDVPDVDASTVHGTVVTAAASFFVAWAIHWIRSRKRLIKSLTWLDIGTYSIGIVLFAVVATYVGRWQYTQYLQRYSVDTLSKLVNDSRALDASANNVLRFIQEVEIVARGYELGSPLPPISRLEDRQIVRRCQTLRRELGRTFKLLTILLVESHGVVQPYINPIDLQRYHDIYEVSMVEYSQAAALEPLDSEAESESLKELRFSMRLYMLARRVLLCDLLALQQSTGWIRLHCWKSMSEMLRAVEAETAMRQKALSTLLDEEEWGNSRHKRTSVEETSQYDGESTQDYSAVKMQLRRFDDIAHSVRSLNAKVHLIKEEINGLTSTKSEDTVIASALSKRYDSVGTEIRNLMSEWERGKNVMLQSIDQDHERASCSSSSVRTPISPSPSLRGVQIIDGGPADALHLLNGNMSPLTSSTKGIFEEEIFEAIASRGPRKRMSMGAMSREEKIAKLHEERQKRATMQEQSDNTTNMLRELQMVIKHRPKGSPPSAKRVTSI